jgi:trans-aconitate 2-methyltransferase
MSAPWDAEHYLKFGEERTRPAQELAARVELPSPGTVIDLGCGPGNSTQVLLARWPDARIIGVDSSAEMIEAARGRYPDQEWIIADAATWSDGQKYDLVFSNAMLHWIPDHSTLVPNLLSLVADGGALAFQIPSGTETALRRHVREVSHDPEWTDRMDAARSVITIEEASCYYDMLSSFASKIDTWETTYQQVMNSAQEIVDWISSTGLRPYLDALQHPAEQKKFVEMLASRVTESYPVRDDGKVLFPFGRLFVIAYR